jgi:hypothetical protein
MCKTNFNKTSRKTTVTPKIMDSTCNSMYWQMLQISSTAK